MKDLLAVISLLMMIVAAPAFAANDITFAWDASTPTTSVAGYEILHGQTIGGPYPNTVDAGNVLQHTIMGMPFGTHFFRVRAYNTGKTIFSGNSNELSKEFVLVLTPPANFRIVVP